MTDRDRTWPGDWEARRSGADCEFCASRERRVDDNGNIRVFVGRRTNAYLHRMAPQPGFVSVRWNGPHLADPCEMEGVHASEFWIEVMHVARAVRDVFAPCHLNYDILGNSVPHVHANIICRYLDDPSPGTPIRPWVLHEVAPAELQERAAQLEARLSGRP